MSSQYSLIASQWPELHEEALKVEQFALGDPRTACFYARRTIELLVEWVYDNDFQLERPVAAQTLAELMYARVFCDLAEQLAERDGQLRDQRQASLATQEELDRLRQEITAPRKANEAAAQPEADLSEFETRRGYIDHYLEEAGWVHGRTSACRSLRSCGGACASSMPQPCSAAISSSSSACALAAFFALFYLPREGADQSALPRANKF